ncbi:MAG: hypothetical protein H7Z72_04505 [Bacteroidetes bacterium]|nr:hypothetical protein [Fibrella sp.]
MPTLYLIGWLILLSALTAPAQAQLTHASRLELATHPNDDETFDVTPLAERGVLVTNRRDDNSSYARVDFQFTRYDESFTPQWSTGFSAGRGFRPTLSFRDEQFLYWLFDKDDSNQFVVLRLNTDDGVTETFEGKLPSPLDMQQFRVMGNVAYFGGYYHNRPVVMVYTFFDQTIKVLPGLYVNNLEITSIETDQAHGEIHVLVHSLKRHCQFSIRSYSPDGKPLRTVEFNEAEHSLISGKLLPVNADESILIGNYSTDCTPYSQGIYATRIRHTEGGKLVPEAIQYIAFSDLKNFFNYLKPKQQERLMTRVGKKKDRGREFRFHYRLLVHAPLPTPDGLTLLAEVYYPQYRGTNMPYGTGGILRQYLEGYRYTHAFACGFDQSGKLLWDNCLPIKELNSPQLTEMVQVAQRGDTLVLAYPQEGDIVTQVIRGSTVLKTPDTHKLQANSADEKIMSSADETLVAWHDRYFLAYGYQTIRTDKNSVAPPREVFYLNKLTYDPNKPVDKPITTRKNGGSGR